MAAARIACGGAAGTASVASQQQARALIRDILAQDVITPTPQGCAILRERVAAMTSQSLGVSRGAMEAATMVWVGLGEADAWVRQGHRVRHTWRSVSSRSVLVTAPRET